MEAYWRKPSSMERTITLVIWMKCLVRSAPRTLVAPFVSFCSFAFEKLIVPTILHVFSLTVRRCLWIYLSQCFYFLLFDSELQCLPGGWGVSIQVWRCWIQTCGRSGWVFLTLIEYTLCFGKVKLREFVKSRLLLSCICSRCGNYDRRRGSYSHCKTRM